MQQPTRVKDPGTVRVLSHLVDDAVDDASATLRVDWLKQRGWIAFPVPGGYYSLWDGDPEVPNLTAGIIALGSEKLLAANADFPEKDPDFAWEAEATLDGLMAIANELSIWYFLVTDPVVSFLVYCTGGDYHIVAGPPSFVLGVLGGDLEKATADFLEHAATLEGGSHERFLLKTLDVHRELLEASGYPLRTPRKEHRKTFWYISVHRKGDEKELDVIPIGVDFGLYAAQCSFGRDRHDPMTGEIPIRPENLDYAWAPIRRFDFESFDYFLASYEP